jgi:hypothetical protein
VSAGSVREQMSEHIKSGIYTAQGQPDIIVLYDGHLRDDAEHHGPWIQWRFPWETDEQYKSSLCFQFAEMLKAGKYALAKAVPSQEMR